MNFFNDDERHPEKWHEATVLSHRASKAKSGWEGMFIDFETKHGIVTGLWSLNPDDMRSNEAKGWDTPADIVWKLGFQGSSTNDLNDEEKAGMVGNRCKIKVKWSTDKNGQNRENVVRVENINFEEKIEPVSDESNNSFQSLLKKKKTEQGPVEPKAKTMDDIPY